MIVDIDKIVITNRIRKDFGDIQELAEDIKKNGLINPPTINKEYRLLAGERRLRACKMLGWNQIPVHMLDTKNEAHDLAVEMSENNMRRNFTGSELAEGIRRQMAIESEKARERMTKGVRGRDASTANGRTRDKAGAAFGISGMQAEKVLFVDDHRDLLDPADFAEWDEGKLSTHKAYQRIKNALAKKEHESMHSEIMMLKSKVNKTSWRTQDVRRLLSQPPKHDNEPCFICGGHPDIVILHHVIQVSELTDYINAGLIDANEVESPIVWLCPNCHSYVHAAIDGNVDVAMRGVGLWWDKFIAIIDKRTEWMKSLLNKSGGMCD